MVAVVAESTDSVTSPRSDETRLSTVVIAGAAEEASEDSSEVKDAAAEEASLLTVDVTDAMAGENWLSTELAAYSTDVASELNSDDRLAGTDEIS